MGSNSNRSPIKEERLCAYIKEVTRCKDISSSEFQLSTGAKIRGMLGIDKGNDFIKAIKKAITR